MANQPPKKSQQKPPKKRAKKEGEDQVQGNNIPVALPGKSPHQRPTPTSIRCFLGRAKIAAPITPFPL
jgi:hypothetical protein